MKRQTGSNARTQSDSSAKGGGLRCQKERISPAGLPEIFIEHEADKTQK